MLVSQFFIATGSAVLMAAMFANVDDISNIVSQAMSAFVATIIFTILILYISVHYQLIKRLSMFYPNFYFREKKKVRICDKHTSLII